MTMRSMYFSSAKCIFIIKVYYEIKSPKTGYRLSVGQYIDSTIETIDDLGLSIISMVFFALWIVMNSVNDRKHLFL